MIHHFNELQLPTPAFSKAISLNMVMIKSASWINRLNTPACTHSCQVAQSPPTAIHRLSCKFALGLFFFNSVLGHGIICFQISEDHFMFNTTMSLCNGPHPLGLFWKNLTGVRRALTSTLFSTFRIKWNTNYEPGLFARHQRLTALLLLGLNESKSLKPVANSRGKPSQTSGGGRSIMAMVLI